MIQDCPKWSRTVQDDPKQFKMILLSRMIQNCTGQSGTVLDDPRLSARPSSRTIFRRLSSNDPTRGYGCVANGTAVDKKYYSSFALLRVSIIWTLVPGYVALIDSDNTSRTPCIHANKNRTEIIIGGRRKMKRKCVIYSSLVRER